MYTIAICSPYRQEADTLRMSVHNILDQMKVAHVIYYYKDALSLSKILKKYPEKYNLLFLDTDLSPQNGIDLSRKLREEGYEYPIVLLSRIQWIMF